MLRVLLTTMLLLAHAPAFGAEPSASSIERLLTMTNAKALNDSALQQAQEFIKPMLAKAVNTANLPPAERQDVERFLADFAQRMNAILIEELSWDRSKEITVRIYRETFSQEEVDALIAFYESPTGKMILEKMPAVVQRTMTALQEQMGPLLQKMQRTAEDVANEIKAKRDTAK